MYPVSSNGFGDFDWVPLKGLGEESKGLVDLDRCWANGLEDILSLHTGNSETNKSGLDVVLPLNCTYTGTSFMRGH